MIDSGLAHAQTTAAYLAVREYAKTEPYVATVRWLEALIDQQLSHMASCGRDRLADAQVRLKQLMALRSALADPGGAFTGHQLD